MEVAEERKKCSHCKVNLPLSHYRAKRSGDLNKMCNYCCEVNKKYKESTKCTHGKQKYYCVECGGKGMCIHGTQTYYCVECKGNGICDHSKRRNECFICEGSQICEHTKKRNRCTLCNGSQICIHEKRKDICKICNLKVYLRHIVTSRMYDVLGYAKFEWLGCSIEEYIVYLESQFGDKFKWEDCGEIFEIDHIKPLGIKGITEEERILRFHYLNTQPLTKSENRRKHVKEI